MARMVSGQRAEDGSCPQLPEALIGRLAVDQRLRGQGKACFCSWALCIAAGVRDRDRRGVDDDAAAAVVDEAMAGLFPAAISHEVVLILFRSNKMHRMGSTMPARAPPIGDVLEARLKAMGVRIRGHRERQKVSATVAAEAAGMSRVTLHRIERGEPSVTMGAYLSAIDAVGLEVELSDPQARQAGCGTADLPARVRLSDYPQLQRLAWQLHGVDDLSPAEALSLYERNWRHIDPAGLEPAERALVQALADQSGGGRLLV